MKICKNDVSNQNSYAICNEGIIYRSRKWYCCHVPMRISQTIVFSSWTTLIRATKKQNTHTIDLESTPCRALRWAQVWPREESRGGDCVQLFEKWSERNHHELSWKGKSHRKRGEDSNYRGNVNEEINKFHRTRSEMTDGKIGWSQRN